MVFAGKRDFQISGARKARDFAVRGLGACFPASGVFGPYAFDFRAFIAHAHIPRAFFRAFIPQFFASSAIGSCSSFASIAFLAPCGAHAAPCAFAFFASFRVDILETFSWASISSGLQRSFSQLSLR